MSFDFSQSRSVFDSDDSSSTGVTSGIPSGLETGAILRERREAMGVSLEEAEASIRIRQKYLAAMEADEWHLLPGEIVGRGFLRNYAAYLDLEPDEMLERRRSVIEPRLAAALRSTSAGAPLPPVRNVNYDPKELDLKDEPEGIEGTSFNFRGLIPILSLLLLAYVVWQGFGFIQSTVGALNEGIQAQIEEFRANAAQRAAEEGVADSNNGTAGDGTGSSGEAATVGDLQGQVQTESSEGNTSEVPESVNDNNDTNRAAATTDNVDGSTSNNGGSEQNDSEQGVATPVPAPSTPTPIPEPPTPIPEPPTAVPEPPTAVPEPPTAIPEPPTAIPVVAAPICPDARSIITSPGQDQVVTGQIEIIGSATHEAFQFYKLEYAPGANAAGGWAYFDGSNSPVAQGRLGTLDSPSLANGVYSLQLVVVDLSANFPPPCQVTITIQN